MHVRTTVAIAATVGFFVGSCTAADPETSPTTLAADSTSTDATANMTSPTTDTTPVVPSPTQVADTPPDADAPGDTTGNKIGAPQTALGAVVIAAADLSAPWSQVGFDEGAVDDGTDDTEICGLQDGALSQLSGGGEGSTASSQFQQSERGPFLTTFAVDPSDSVDVRATFDAFVTAATSCTEFSIVDESGQSATYQVEPTAIQPVGDDVFAAVLTVAAGQQTVHLLIAVALSNDVLLGASQVELDAPPDVDFLGQLLATMASRL